MLWQRITTCQTEATNGMVSIVSDERDPNAPNLEHLRAMRPFVRGVARGTVQNTIGGKGVKVSLPQRPTRICNICGAGYDFIRSSNDVQLKHDQSCAKCKDTLKEGYTAFISDNRFCFGKSHRLADMAGSIVRVNAEIMNSLEGKFKIEKRFQHPNGDGKDVISE